MPESSGNHVQAKDVLTLNEAAAYLRIPEERAEKLVLDRTIPAQNIDGEWRFSRRGLDDWLRFGNSPHKRWPYPPELLFHSPFAEDLLALLEERLLYK